eukprot:TRINITY_DN2085_c0_g1_i2.p1 TRINITY_DN2085_c0_g1~~TRINITY_DN2085_c0_g1_i2.p1  ORF type:complete len:164 (+),score=50.15 TRINITY_DN2085_c0_g1_i2:109-600(+)
MQVVRSASVCPTGRALASQRRAFLHLLLFKRKRLSPGLQNPWKDLPEWQQYLRKKALEDPKYHQSFFDEINPEKNRLGRKAQLFAVTVLLTWTFLYHWVVTVQCDSLHLECLAIKKVYDDREVARASADQRILNSIREKLDEVKKQNSGRRRANEYRKQFEGI